MDNSNEVLAERIAIVTGASSGIGRAIAKRFVEEGANVVICSRSQGEIDSVADELTNANTSGRVVGIECDVTDSEAVAALIDATVAEFGGIDIVVPNAGGTIKDENLHRITIDTFEANVDLNLTGQFRTVKHALPHMIAGGGGSIVFMGTVNALTGIGLTGYSTAKGGIISLCRLVAVQYGRHGIRANVISPGTIATGSRQREMVERPSDDEWTNHDEWLSQYPLGRFGRPNEVADATLFLASERSSFVTGTNLVVDGGITAGLDQSFQTQIYQAGDVLTTEE